MLICVSGEEYKFVFVKYIGNPGWNFDTLKNRTPLSRLYSEQWIRKCLSSSKIPQTLQVRSQIWTFGLEYRPRSIARVCELVLSWATATLYLWFFNMYRYGSITKELLNLLCFWDKIVLYILHISIPLGFKLGYYHVFTFNSKIRWQFSYIHTVVCDHFIYSGDPCRKHHGM